VRTTPETDAPKRGVERAGAAAAAEEGGVREPGADIVRVGAAWVNLGDGCDILDWKTKDKIKVTDVCPERSSLGGPHLRLLTRDCALH
jgi:hypothetical protein